MRPSHKIDRTTGRCLPEGQHDDRGYFDCGCGYEECGDTPAKHDAYWAFQDGKGNGAPQHPSIPIPPGVVDAPDPRDLHREVPEGPWFTGYVGDNDHAPPDVDRGGFTWRDGAGVVHGLGELDEMSLNPKDAAQLRDKKPPLDLLEREANEATAWAMAHGAAKYGRQNYLTIPIHARIYAAAVMRHAQQFLDGEDQDADSGLSHWAHIGANVHVFLAALAAGKVVDDRGPAPRTPEQEERSEVSNHGRNV